MARVCNVCGERIRPRDKICNHCGMRVEGVNVSVTETSKRSREALNIERENLTRTIERVKRDKENTATRSNQKQSGKKKLGCGYLVYMIIIMIGIGVIAPIIMNVVVKDQNVAEEVVVKSKEVETTVITSNIYMLEEAASDNEQATNRINTYSPNTKAFIVSGIINGIKEGTPINLVFWDETEGWMLTSDEVIVYSYEDGSFYYELETADIDYNVGGITYPGNYSVIVTIDNEDYSDFIPFGVYSDQEGKQLYSDLFNDIYMIKDVAEGECDVVSNYPIGSTVLKAELSYIHIPAQTMVKVKWLTKKNDAWEEIIFDEELTYYIAKEDGESFMHNFWITDENGWQPGQYKVEIFLDNNRLAAVREFTVGE